MKAEIKKLFSELSRDEQIAILKELSSMTGTSISISEFAQKVQRKYGRNVEFEVSQSGEDHCPTVEATVLVPFGKGKYTAIGSNQKIAKAKACEKANAEFD